MEEPLGGNDQGRNEWENELIAEDGKSDEVVLQGWIIKSLSSQILKAFPGL